MKNNIVAEVSVALVLVALFIAILNPLHLWMPDMVHMTMLALGVVVFGAYAAFVVRESAHDEREATHRARSGRAAYLVGAGALACGVLYQGYMGSIDPWLVFALVLMVVAKLAVYTYDDHNH